MTNNIAITVAICVYNAEKYIEETLNSLKNQTFKNFKLLIIDDKSTDNSLKVISEYLENNSNYFEYKIIELKQNSGTAIGRNLALESVDTEYMMFFDADDIAKIEMIETLYTKMQENENYIAVSCHSKYIDMKGNKISGGQYIGPKSELEFKNKASDGKLIFMLPPTLFKVSYALKAGGYRQDGFPRNSKIRYQDLSEDLDLWSRVSDFYIDNKVMITVPKVLFYYRKNTSSLSASKDSLIAMQNKIRFIKTNLKRRRQNIEELTFIQFMENQTSKDKLKNWFKDMSAHYYRKAGFLYVEKKYFSFLLNITLSVILNPFYLIDKINNNIRKSS